MGCEAPRTHPPSDRARRLVAKAGLIELVEDDRAVLFGLLVEAAAKLRSDDRDQQLLLWRRRGKRAFESDSLHATNPAPIAGGNE